MPEPMRYSISDWHQLKDCQSNNSRELYISVTDYIGSQILSGLRISVLHLRLGALFTCVLNASGTIVSEINDNISVEFSTSRILLELEKYGFIVEYHQSANLPSGQLDYLETIDSLGYDKIRILPVYTSKNGVKTYMWYIVAFNANRNASWLSNTYEASTTEFTESLRNGSAFNVSSISRTQNWSWSWLDFVADVQDVLHENGR